MQAFDEVHRAIHYPPDRRFRVWIDRRFIFAFAVVALAPVAIALGTISDRRTSNGNFPAADQSGKSSSSAWFSRLVATDPFRELLFSDAPCPQRTLHFDGSPAALLEPPLHAKHGMAAAHTPQGSHGPFVDSEGRRSLHFPVGGPAWLSAHRGNGASMALSFSPYFPS